MRKICFFAVFIILFSSVIAQNEDKTTPISMFKTTKSYGFDKPLMFDSIGANGKKFSANDYLCVPNGKQDIDRLNDIVANNGVVTLDNSGKDFTSQTLYFTINTDKYVNRNIEIKSNAAFIVSIDGQKADEKLAMQSEWDSATAVTIKKSLEPGNHIVGISVMCEGNKTYKLSTTLDLQNNGELRPTIGDNRSGLTLQTMLCGENPYHTSISASGKYYLVKYYDTDTKGYSKYRIEVRSSNNDEIIFKDDKITSYAWMPVSDLLYYTENSKVLTLNPASGERKVLIEDLKDNSTVSFFDNEKDYILSTVIKNDNTSGDLRRMYMPDDRIPGWRDRTTLSLVKDMNAQPLFHSHSSTYLNDVCSNGNILFSISKDNPTKRPFTFNSIFEYNPDTKKLDTLVFEDGFVNYAQYLQDNENIVLVASNEAFNSIGSTLKKGQIPNAFNYSIYIMNLKTKKITPVAKNFNPSINSIIVRKNNIYLTCTDKDSINVYRYDINKQTFNLLDLGVDIVFSFDVSKDEKTFVYYGENYNKPKRVFRAVVNNNNEVKTTEVYFPKKDAFAQMGIGKMETYSFKMHGTNIDGRLYYPTNFDKTKKYPMVVYYYGGCTPTDRSFEMRYSAWLYTQQDYVVYVINPSGTIGWGQEFAARHVNTWGDFTADEIIEGVKRVCKDHSFIDSKKVGCMGASYGGFMTQYLQTKTDIFAAAVSHAGISNITSYWGEGYWGYSYSGAASADSYPWNNPTLYTQHSPLFNADKIKTPLLLLHGTSDTNVPIGESIQMYNALKILGKEVEFITVKGENHGIVDFNKRMQWNNTIYAWFAKCLKGDSSWWDSMYPKEEF